MKDHHKPENYEWSALEKPLRRFRIRRPPEICFLELAKGFEPPTP
jgi:hypothetical protein